MTLNQPDIWPMTTSDVYLKHLALIQSIASNWSKQRPTFDNIRTLFCAYHDILGLMQSTSNPYKFQVLSETLTLCFRMIIKCYELTQSVKEETIIQDKMIPQDVIFVGNSIGFQPMHKTWISKTECDTLSLLMSIGTVYHEKILENVYPISSNLMGAEECNNTSFDILSHQIQSGQSIEDILNNTENTIKCLERCWLHSNDRYWPIKDAVQLSHCGCADSFGGTLILDSIYRDSPMPVQISSKKKPTNKLMSKNRGGDLRRIVRGCTISLATNRLCCRLAANMTARESSGRAALVVGPNGCGKATLCQKVVSLIGAKLIDLTHVILSLHLEAKDEAFDSNLQRCIQNEFKRAVSDAPCIILIRNCERMFISSSKRDIEYERSQIFRAMKPHVVEEFEKVLTNSKVFILGTSSHPDDCVGKDKEELISFFNSDIICLTHADHYSRMAGIAQELRTRKIHLPWPALSELSSQHSNCSWDGIKKAIQKACEHVTGSSCQWEDIFTGIERSFQLEEASEDTYINRHLRMAEIETWVQDHAHLFSPFTNICM